MKSLALPLAAALLFTAAPAGAAPQAQREAAWDLDAAKAAMDAVEAFDAAMDSGNADAALALLAEDLTVYEGGHVERSRAEYAAEHLPADIDFSRQVRSEVTAASVRATGDVAMVMRETRTRGTYNGKPVDSFGTGTYVPRRHADGWRITHIHWSSRKAPAAPAT